VTRDELAGAPDAPGPGPAPRPAPAPAPPQIMQPRQALELTEAECWQLLGSVSLGRVVFTHRAMPAIRPVNHLLDDRRIIVRSHLGAAIVSRATAEGSVVCYEVDDLDPVRHTGWSVIVTGMARLVQEPAAIERYEELLEPWIAGQMDHVISIEPQFVSGIRLVGWCN
jgi:nitroimidazol reductase NimA-like FMN-containing flavoprotein (pyridoxamine 5'-phosphate oxidase superfamily)